MPRRTRTERRATTRLPRRTTTRTRAAITWRTRTVTRRPRRLTRSASGVSARVPAGVAAGETGASGGPPAAARVGHEAGASAALTSVGARRACVACSYA